MLDGKSISPYHTNINIHIKQFLSSWKIYLQILRKIYFLSYKIYNRFEIYFHVVAMPAAGD